MFSLQFEEDTEEVILIFNTDIIYESTVYPGVTEDECVPILEKYSGLIFNKDFLRKNSSVTMMISVSTSMMVKKQYYLPQDPMRRRCFGWMILPKQLR